MISGILAYKPEAVSGLGFGGTLLLISLAKPGTAGRAQEIRRIYLRPPCFLPGGTLRIPREMLGLTTQPRHRAEIQDIRRLRPSRLQDQKYKPYFRFDWLRVTDSDPFYTGLAEDEVSYTTGLLRPDHMECHQGRIPVRDSDQKKKRSDNSVLVLLLIRIPLNGRDGPMIKHGGIR